MSSKIDKNTIKSLQEGDLGAFNTVFRTYYNNVKYYIRDLVKSADDAEELTQEVFLKLWVIKGRIDVEKNLRSFLFKIAHNQALKHIKKKLKEENFMAEFSVHTEENPMTDDEYLKNELLLRIELAVEGLSKQKRKIYRMRINQGINIEVIAEKLNISIRTVSNTLRLAINEVRQKISTIFLLLLLFL